MKKIVVCLTGVVNRSIQHTWMSIQDNLIEPLQKKYDVEIAIFNNNVEDCFVDGVLVNNKDMSVISHNYLYEYKQKEIDREIEQMKGYEIDYSPYFTGKLKQNAFRLLYIESKVAEFIETNKNVYEYVVVSNADYFYVNQFPIDSLTTINENSLGTCHHLDAGGITDGFYVGCPNTIYKLMNRIHTHELVVKDKSYGCSYEKQLQQWFLLNNITRIKLKLVFVKIRANLHIAGSHMSQWSIPIKQMKQCIEEKDNYRYLLDLLQF